MPVNVSLAGTFHSGFIKEKKMKNLVTSALILIGLSTWAQESVTLDDYSLINVATEEVNEVYYSPEAAGNLKSGSKGCEINVTYTNFTEEAKAAFEYAISIWEENIVSSVPINIHANMDNIGAGVLGLGKPGNFLRNFKSTPLSNVYYPVALAEKISGKEQNKSTDADITCTFNSTMSWYYGTDGKTPSTKYDFVSAVLHEIGHGMGFAGFFKSENGVGLFSNSSNLPSVYDYYIFNQNNQRLADKDMFPSPSHELTRQLTSNALVINYETEIQETGAATIYAPSAWTSGVSIYHLKKVNANDPAELMGAYAYKGEAKHNLGKNTLQVLSEIGWGEKSAQVATSIFTANDDDLLANASVNVFPNPCNDVLNISFPATDADTQVTIEVISLTGKTVFRENWNDAGFNPEKRIDLSSIESGIYLVQTTDENAKKFTNKIIKN